MKIVVAWREHDMGIAYQGKIPWRLIDDLKLFKAITLGHTVIMGRKTWDSLGRKLLPYRQNIVVSRSDEYHKKYCSTTFRYRLPSNEFNGDSIIIGGAEIYRQALQNNQVNVILASVIKNEVYQGQCDTFFPAMCDWGGTWKSEKLLPFKAFDLWAFYKERA